ncbi:hypothetical protein LIA77_00829 [Sarocladium implicatum]|nr:hypothetical protein LIA77_00829 [Sarocladium implicatum]
MINGSAADRASVGGRSGSVIYSTAASVLTVSQTQRVPPCALRQHHGSFPSRKYVYVDRRFPPLSLSRFRHRKAAGLKVGPRLGPSVKVVALIAPSLEGVELAATSKRHWRG